MAGVATASMMPTEDTTFLAEEHLGRDLQEYGDEDYGDEEEDYDEDEESNEEVPVAVKVEEKPFMMGGQPTSIDMSKLNQCRPGYGFHIPGVMKCVRDPSNKKDRNNNNGRFGDQSKDKMKKRRNNNNEDNGPMMGGRPTSIDMSKLNQCRPGYGFHTKGKKRCTKDPQGRRGDSKGKGNNGRQGQRPSGKQMQRMQKMRKAM